MRSRGYKIVAVRNGMDVGGERFSIAGKDTAPQKGTADSKPVCLLTLGLITVVGRARQSLVFTGLTRSLATSGKIASVSNCSRVNLAGQRPRR